MKTIITITFTCIIAIMVARYLDYRYYEKKCKQEFQRGVVFCAEYNKKYNEYPSYWDIERKAENKDYNIDSVKNTVRNTILLPTINMDTLILPEYDTTYYGRYIAVLLDSLYISPRIKTLKKIKK